MKTPVLARRIHLPWAITLSALILCTPATRAQTGGSTESLIVFPRFVSYQYESSGIAIFNPTDREASVSLTLRWWDGALVATVPNPVTIAVPPKGQVARTSGQLFGTEAYFDASLEIRSYTPGIVAYYQTFDSDQTFLDGADAPLPSANLVFPVIPGPDEGASEIDLLNFNPRSTAVELKLWSLDGRQLGRASIQLPAYGIYRNLTNWIFPDGTSFSGASHVTATSKPLNMFSQAQPVMGTSLFAGFSSYALPGGYYDVAALNALSQEQAPTAGAFPYFKIGPAHASTLSLANLESASVEVTLTAIANNGSPLGNRKVTLSANGGLRAPLANILTSLQAGGAEGWLLLQATGRIAGALIYGRSDAAALTATPLLRAPKTDFFIPQVVQNRDAHTEITLANPTPNTSNIDIYVVGAEGRTAAHNQVAIGPSKRQSFHLRQLVPEIEDQSGGILYVTANEPVFAVATMWNEDGSLASSFLPQSLTQAFYPGRQDSFAVAGQVTLNDLPASGFTVALSGPRGGLATTDEFGFYAFTDLPPGKYSMMVDQFGFQFEPPQVNFELREASVRQDFRGYTSADAIMVRPAAIPVDSDDTLVDIYGSEFNSSSEAFVDGIRLNTSFLASTRLQAVMPAYLLESPARYDMVVVTNPDRADRRTTRPYSVVVYVDRPKLVTVVTNGTPVEGSAGETITLLGSGFLKGARVKVNGSSEGIEAIFKDSNTIIAQVPARYFAQGGIYPVTVENPYPASTESNVQLLAVYYPAPVLEGLLPASLPARLEPAASPVNLEVRGYGFRRGATVLFNGRPLFTSSCEGFCGTIRLYAVVPPELLAASGFAEISVENPSPSLGSSETVYLQIEGLQPTITSVQPGSATALDTPFKYTMPVLVHGTNFGSQTQVRVYPAWSSPPSFKSSGEVVSSTQLTVFINVEYPSALGEWKVEVANPPPGGGVSEPVSFLISEGSFVANPFIVSINPQFVAAGGPSFTLTINGTNLKQGATAFFYYTPLATTVVSDRQMRAEVPASLIQSPGRIPICVTNPDNGGTSNRLFLEIR